MSLSDALLLEPYPFQIWIACRTDGIKGSGTLNDPYDGSTQARFDEIMRSLPAMSRIHLGPGNFETEGYWDGRGAGTGWEIQPGMVITGAGMDATTLKLLPQADTGEHYFAIGHLLAKGDPLAANPVDFCEVADLTIDCNWTDNTEPYAAGAIRLMGNHVKIQRVKAVNWGADLTGQSGFVFAVVTASREGGLVETVNAGIEGCVAVAPAGSAGTVTVFHAGGKEEEGVQEEAFGWAPYIRHCFVDGGTMSNPPKDTRGLSMGLCHSGIVEGNQVHNVKCGGPYQDKASTWEIAVRGNWYKNVMFPLNQQLVSPQAMGHWLGGMPLEKLEYDDGELICDLLARHPFAEYDNSLVVAKTRLPHGLKTGEIPPARVHILGNVGDPSGPKYCQGVVVYPYCKDAAVYNDDPASGTGFAVLEASTYEFTYEGNGTATVPAVTGSWPCWDVFASFRVPENLRPIRSLERNGNIVTATTYYKYPGVDKGDAVAIVRAVGPDGQPSQLNGNWRVIESHEAVGDEEYGYFRFEVDAGEPPGSGFCAGYYGRIWQFHRLQYENNLMDLAVLQGTPVGGRSIGFFIYADLEGLPPEMIVRHLVVRQNVIRTLGNAPAPTNIAMELHRIEAALLQGNIVNLESAENETQSTIQLHTAAAKTHTNWSPSGQLVRARELQSQPGLAPDMETQVRAELEEVVLMSFFR